MTDSYDSYFFDAIWSMYAQRNEKEFCFASGG